MTYFATYALLAAGKFLLTDGWSGPVTRQAALSALGFAIGPAFAAVVAVDRTLWRFRPARVLLGIRVPDVSGRWTGYIRSTFSNHGVEYAVVLEIWQTLSHVSVWYYDERAVTHSLVAGFSDAIQEGPARLYAVYRNQPVTTTMPELQAHTGVMDLVIDQRRRRITGTYFNNPHERATYGELRAEYAQRQRIGAFSVEE